MVVVVVNNDINLVFGKFRSSQDEPQTMSCKPIILANLEKVRSVPLPKESAQVLAKTSVTTHRISRYQIHANLDGSQHLVLVEVLGLKTTYQIMNENSSSDSGITLENPLGKTQPEVPVREISPVGLGLNNQGFFKNEPR